MTVQAYSNNLVDHHLILDLLPFLVRAFFAQRLPAPMSYGQAAILVSLGLQQRSISDCEKDLNLPASQVLALFNKVRSVLPAQSRCHRSTAVVGDLLATAGSCTVTIAHTDLSQNFPCCRQEAASAGPAMAVQRVAAHLQRACVPLLRECEACRAITC